MAKITTIRAEVLSIQSDRTPYKPYSHELQPKGLFVELTIPEDAIADKDKDGTVVVTMDGFSALLGRIADSIDSMHKEHEYKQTGMRR